MSRVAKSVLVYGCYALLAGSLMAVNPNFLLGPLGLRPETEVGIRVAGLLLISNGIYCVLAAWHEVTEFFRWSVYTRTSVIFIFGIFVLLDFDGPGLLLLGLIDLLAAIWTALELRHKLRFAI